MKNRHKLVFIISMLICSACSHTSTKSIDLSGKWNVHLDSIGNHFIMLPGSLAENRVGIAVKDSSVSMLSEGFHYIGAAVYTKEIKIPHSWEGKPLELFIERTKVSTVFLDDSLIGSQKSVSTPHSYLLLNGLTEGNHELKIIVDNTKSLLPLGGSHAYSEHTQTNWNGILGDFYIRCLEGTDIQTVRVEVAEEGDGEVNLTVLNTDPYKKDEYFEIIIYDTEGNECLRKQQRLEVVTGESTLRLFFNLSKPELWDEYSPRPYTLQVHCIGNEIKKQVTFGIRSFKANGSKLENNGRTVFLRGKHEGGVFPLTGYAEMRKEEWKRYFSIVRSYGLNHVRFHSWCPPEAAFQAADEQGIFLQVELPLWGSYTTGDTLLTNYMKTEGEKIMKVYGNHPSFVMFSLGNELAGDTCLMRSVVEHLKEKDPRHLYAMGTNNFYWDTRTYACEDFFSAMRYGKETSDMHTDLRGSFSFADSNDGGIINSYPPNTLRNFENAINGLNKPVIGHETGQYQTFPDFKEIKKYTGVMQPLNFYVIKKRLTQAGLISQAENFLKASGALSALCYREEIEMALRTSGFSGFQLLDLEDYPGQGTALIGILNAFMESKGVISQEHWTKFCNDVTPLARFPKYCWSTNEVFKADIEVAHYGKKDLLQQKIRCSLLTESGRLISEKHFTADLKQGNLNNIASIEIPLNCIEVNEKLSLLVSLEDTDYNNSWDIWVYRPDSTSIIKEGQINNITVTRNSDLFSRCVVEGRKVLYIPHHEEIAKQSVGGLFITDFWNYSAFKQTAINMKKEPSPGTFGLLINSTHPIFKSFPTDFHTNWQWWNIIKHSRPMILDNYPSEFRPIVQVIDNWDRNHKLGLIYEVPETKGKALVCVSDLFVCSENIEVKALFSNLINYLKNLE